MAAIENRPEGWVVVVGERVIPADDEAHAQQLLGALAYPPPAGFTRVKVLAGKLRIDNGKGTLRDGEVVLFDGPVPDVGVALASAADHPAAANVGALAPYRRSSP